MQAIFCILGSTLPGDVDPRQSIAPALISRKVLNASVQYRLRYSLMGETDAMFKRILVPIDGSATSNLGLREAIEVAKDQNATLCLLHVVDDMVVTQGFDGTMYVAASYIDEILAALRKEGKAILAKAEAQAKKQALRCESVLVETIGHPVADVIIRQARKCRADLIVLGTHGRRGLTRMVMGSDAEGVVRATRVPVLLVRSPKRPLAQSRRGAKRKT
jgi:nucleotide-binding universal stress UspA family protein